MSKFFKALEKVEQEREAAASAAPAPAAPEAPVAEPAARRVPEVPPKPAPRVTPPRAEPVAPTPSPRVEPAPRREPVPAPRIEPTPGPRVLTPRVEPPRLEPAPATPAPVTPAPVAPAPSPFARRPEPRPTVYGAPVARDNGDIRHGFGWQLEATDDSESGEIDDHLVSLLEPTSFAAEQYRAVRLAIETMRHERGTRVVGISSPGRGDGKTMTALNLAGALAQAPDARVVLVEADLRHPAATRYLGLSAPRGLSSYLLDHSMNLDAVVQRPPSIAFAVVPAGAASSMPYELLKSPRLAGLLAELRQRFDFVLVDTPPALPFPDVGIVRDLVDGFVVVVRANRTPKEMLQDTMSVLGRQRTLGLVFNDDERSGVPTFQPDGDARWKRLMPRPLGARVA